MVWVQRGSGIPNPGRVRSCPLQAAGRGTDLAPDPVCVGSGDPGLGTVPDPCLDGALGVARIEAAGQELAGRVVPPALDVELHPGGIRGRGDLVGGPVRVPRPGMSRVY